MLPRTIEQIYVKATLFSLLIYLTFYLPVDLVSVRKVETLMIGKIELSLLSLAMLVSESILFLFKGLKGWANTVVAGVTLTDGDIILTVSPKKNRNTISKITKNKLNVWNKSV